MENKTIITILIILLLLALGYIALEKSNKYIEEQKLFYNQSGYDIGWDDVVAYWNGIVVNNVNNNNNPLEGNLPFIINGTGQMIPIKQLCEEKS